VCDLSGCVASRAQADGCYGGVSRGGASRGRASRGRASRGGGSRGDAMPQSESTESQYHRSSVAKEQLKTTISYPHQKKKTLDKRKNILDVRFLFQMLLFVYFINAARML